MTVRGFLMTDVVGSTRLWNEHLAEMPAIVRRLDVMVASCVGSAGGSLVKSRGEGDSHFAVFEASEGAVAAAFALRSAVAGEPWPGGLTLTLRIAVATGPAELIQGDWDGPTVNLCARMRSAASPGQILIGEQEAAMAPPPQARFRFLGRVVLRDFAEPRALYEVRGVDEPDGPAGLDLTLSGARTIPAALTSLIGRDDELDGIERAMSECRLVTVVGSPGVGKTRMALAAAERALRDAAVWWVDLVGARSFGPSDVAVTMRLPDTGDPLAAVIDTVSRSGETLLVLDNCEQVALDVSTHVSALLRAAPTLRVLATSRRRLEIAGERVIELAPLALEAMPGHDPPAVALFKARATEAGARGLDCEPSVVSEICRRLDGVPLAIELAAAMTKSMRAPDVLERLDPASLKRSVGGGPHRSMHAAIGSSITALDPAARRLLGQLSIFSGTFTLTDIEAVVGAGDHIADGLRVLTDHSLVTTSEDGAHHRILSVIREPIAGSLTPDEVANLARRRTQPRRTPRRQPPRPTRTGHRRARR